MAIDLLFVCMFQLSSISHGQLCDKSSTFPFQIYKTELLSCNIVFLFMEFRV